MVKNFIEENQEDLDIIHIVLENEKEDEHDPMCDKIWEGLLLGDIPEEYHNREVTSTGQSLAALEQGKMLHYLRLK